MSFVGFYGITVSGYNKVEKMHPKPCTSAFEYDILLYWRESERKFVNYAMRKKAKTNNKFLY